MIRDRARALNSGRLKNVLLALLLGALPIAYYAGGVAGFSAGYSAALFSQSISAGSTVFLLRHLRASDTKVAIDVLERQLDGLLVQNSVGRESFRSSFNLPRLVGVGSTSSIDKGASSALAYRAEFPSTARPPLKATIDDALAKLATRVHEDHK